MVRYYWLTGQQTPADAAQWSLVGGQEGGAPEPQADQWMFEWGEDPWGQIVTSPGVDRKADVMLRNQRRTVPAPGRRIA